MNDLRFLDPNGLVNRESFNERFGLLNNLMNHIGNEYVWEKRDTANQLVGYVNSSDPNAYPPAVDDGFAYNRLGQLGGFAKIATGSYVGTGAYGVNNPCSLTFDFVPKIVVFGHNDLNNNGILTSHGGWMVGSSRNNGLIASVTEKAIIWYSTNSAQNQLNSVSVTYNYIAIG